MKVNVKEIEVNELITTTEQRVELTREVLEEVLRAALKMPHAHVQFLCNASKDGTTELDSVILDQSVVDSIVIPHNAEEMGKIALTKMSGHVMYGTEDADRPKSICDEHGVVQLLMCKVCKQAEGDLALQCPGAPGQPVCSTCDGGGCRDCED